MPQNADKWCQQNEVYMNMHQNIIKNTLNMYINMHKKCTKMHQKCINNASNTHIHIYIYTYIYIYINISYIIPSYASWCIIVIIGNTVIHGL